MAPNRNIVSVDTTQADVRLNKRARVSTEDRKRVDVACTNCRRLKEKCDGRFPCERCQKQHRLCERRPADQRVASSPRGSARTAEERADLLEVIAGHYLGDDSANTANLRRFVQTLELQSGRPLSCTGSGHEGEPDPNVYEASHEAFSKSVCDQVNERLRGSNVENIGAAQPNDRITQPETGRVLPFDSVVLPPREVANFLSDVYFDYAQTITTFADREWTNTKIRELYGLSFHPQPADAGWICTVLSVLAIGALFSHMAAEQDVMSDISSVLDTNEEGEATVGFVLYDAATRLFSDILFPASVDGARALLVLAQFALSTGSEPLAHTYLGCCLDVLKRIEVQFGYRSLDRTLDTQDHLRSIRRSALIWRHRLSILHGIPTCFELNCVSAVALRNDQTDNAEANGSILLTLTKCLQTFASHFHKLAPRDSATRGPLLERLRRACEEYKRWWSTLPTSETPILQLNRKTAHVHLIHRLNLVFVGRPFVLMPKGSANSLADADPPSEVITSFIEEAEYASYAIIDICSMLDRAHGLAKASYIERSSCLAAVMVMLAQSLRGRCGIFREKLELGICLMKKLSPTRKQVSSIEAVEKAVGQLPIVEESKQGINGLHDTGAHTQYLNFKSWAMTLRKHGRSSPKRIQASFLDDSDGQQTIQDLDWDSLGQSLFDLDPGQLNEMYQFLDGDLLRNPMLDGSKQAFPS